MRRIAQAVSALGIMTLLASAPSIATASSDVPLTARTIHPPKPKNTPKKPPKVNLGRTREGATATATTEIDNRLGSHPKATSKTRGKQPTKSKIPTDPHKPKRTREDTTESTEREDIKLNIGVCGRMQPDGSVPGPSRCQPVGVDERNVSRRRDPRVVTPRPQDVTWEEIRSETKNVMFPGLSVKVQPAGRTLVNLDTIVYTEDSKVSRSTVTLLGFPVVVEATPVSYTWHFGDGTPALTTSTPGKAYPSKEITHKYMKRGNVSLTLTTNYAARFNVADTGWQYVDGTVPITGPATPLLVREAVPVLVDPGR